MISGREKIRDAALKEFAERGFDGARIDRIAANAGVNKALIYYHYKNKEELYVSTINELFAQALPESLKMEGLTVREKMFGVVEQFIRFLHEHPYFVLIMDRSVQHHEDFFQNLHEQNLFFEALVALYDEGLEKGECRQVEHIADYAVSFLGACYFYFSHRRAVRKFYGDQEESEIVEAHIETMKDFVSRVLFK